MTELKPYKHFIAIFLLALYAFIATPVQFWHHHNSFVKTTTNATIDNNKGEIIISHSSDKAVNHNCQICTHQYSTYNDNAFTVFTTALIIAAATEEYYYLHIPSSPHFNFTNKGPPSIA